MYIHKYDTLAHLVSALSAAYTAFTTGTGISSLGYTKISSGSADQSNWRSAEALPLLLRGTVVSKIKQTPVANGLLRNTVLAKIPKTFVDPATSGTASKWSSQVKVEFTTSNNADAAEVERIYAALVSIVLDGSFLTSVQNGTPYS